MNSVQEHKNELEAAVRYCESAISRAQATIESMEFRQQAASKAWHEQTGREKSLTKKLEVMTDKYNRMKGYADQLLDENGELEERYDEAKTNMALMTDEIEKLKQANMGLVCDEDDFKDELTDLKKENAKLAASNARLLNREQAVETLQIALSEKDQTIALQRDQIAMFQRKMSRMNEVNR